MAWSLIPSGPVYAADQKRRNPSPIRELECVRSVVHSTCTHIAVELGYSSTAPKLTLEERKRIGSNVEQLLKGEKEAAKAPSD